MVGESRTMTVLFCDVRDFTVLSENLSPRELSAMLNAYLTPMTEIIHAHHGTVDKYVGDAIMAFWGAPDRQSESRARRRSRRAGDAAQNVVAGTGVQKARLARACHRRRHQHRRNERRRHGLRIPQGLHGARRRGQPRIEARGIDQGVRRRRVIIGEDARASRARHPLSRDRSRARQGQGEPGHDIRAAAGSGKRRSPANSRRGTERCCNTASGALPMRRPRSPPLPARTRPRVSTPISPSAARCTPRHDRRRIGTAPPTSLRSSPAGLQHPPGPHLPITDDALDHAAGAGVEIVVHADAGPPGPAKKPVKFPATSG